MDIRRQNKRILAAICAVVIAAFQIYMLIPVVTDAATAGATLSVRVQYFGDRGDKIVEKARFSKSELAGMGSSTYCYSNVTAVGTVMVMKARGPRLTTVIDRAGIDIASVQNVTFRTMDGYTRNFSASQISRAAYYYPNLNLYSEVKPDLVDPTDSTDPTKPTDPTDPTEPTEPVTPTEPTKPAEDTDAEMRVQSVNALAANEKILNYERSADGTTLTPRSGSLKGATTVPAILALEFGSTKRPGRSAAELSMDTAETYRFCLGQSKLTEGKQTKPGYSGGDVTSADSCHSIYGVDVTLFGTPVSGIKLTAGNIKTKVGSRTKVKAKITGDELFASYLDTKNLKWSSSNTKIATVDKNGIVTIKAKGKVIITATAPDGTSASITLGGAKGDKSGANSTKDKKTKNEKKPDGQIIKARQISLGDKITEDESVKNDPRQEMASDAQELGETEQFSKGTVAGSAAVAIAACAGGAAFRLRRYRIDK